MGEYLKRNGRLLLAAVVIVLFCAAWTGVEFYNGQATWGFIFLAAGAYAACSLIIFYKPKPIEEPEKTASEDAA